MVLVFTANAQRPNDFIKYKYHEGTAILKGGGKLKGQFKFEVDELGLKWVFYKGEKGKKKMIPPSFAQITMAGSTPADNIRKDSTTFVWINKYQNLYRQLRRGEVMILDNIYVTDEAYGHIRDKHLIAYKNRVAERINMSNDLEPFFRDNDYFKQLLFVIQERTKYERQVILFLTDFYNNRGKPERLVTWQEGTLTLWDGEILKGKLNIQPLDFSTSNTSQLTRIHFYNNDGFQLLDERDVKAITINGYTFTSLLLKERNTKIYTTVWKDGERDYYINRFVEEPDFYWLLHSFSTNDLHVQEKNKKGELVHSIEEEFIRQKVLKELISR